MGYISAKNLVEAKRKVAKAVAKHNRSNSQKRAIDYVEATNRDGVYVYATRDRR